MQILKVNIDTGVCKLLWWTCWLEEQYEPYMENTSKEFFAPTLMSGLSQSLNFGRAHTFPLFQPVIQALTSKQPCNICEVLLASQMRKEHPKVTAFRNQEFLPMTWWPASPLSSLSPLILFFITPSNIWYQQVIALITWEEELPDLLDSKQSGSHAVAVFKSNHHQQPHT